MKRLLLVVCALALTTPTYARADLSGIYGCTGTGQDGEPYAVDLEITSHGQHYMLTWTIEGNPTAYGFGMVSGDILSVYFRTPKGDGLSSYTVTPTALSGRWTALGAEESWPEVCTIGGQAKTV